VLVLNMHEIKPPLSHLFQQQKSLNFVRKSDSYESQNTDIIFLNSAKWRDFELEQKTCLLWSRRGAIKCY